ncbi:MAG: UDP-N-acetylglucosamine 2-epimerase (non-hydrolyzing) [Proteobacteria bacterium]|nr:UDP-N-acetylglucosamine 2-epimerase (non-hydrolyzing) [Pseudomonadota bacterium]
MLLVCYGTRPEYLKVKPLIEKMRGVIPFKTLFSGQHTDMVSVDSDYTINIENKNNRLDSVVASIMNGVDFIKESITHVLVQGDTVTAYAMALSAFHHKIPIIHLEAGMRTYNINNPWPEEMYRQCISKMASYHLTPTKHEWDFLISEKCKGEIHIVGNTVLDNLVDIYPIDTPSVLITMHRRENYELFPEYFKEIEELATKNMDMEFVFPMHPSPDVQKHRHIFKNVTVKNPLEYDDMIGFISSSRIIITDSGGIQEEASFFKKKTIVCRETTERFASLGKSSVLCTEPSKLKSIFNQAKEDYIVEDECPFGDGHASEKIVEILKCIV